MCDVVYFYIGNCYVVVCVCNCVCDFLLKIVWYVVFVIVVCDGWYGEVGIVVGGFYGNCCCWKIDWSIGVKGCCFVGNDGEWIECVCVEIVCGVIVDWIGNIVGDCVCWGDIVVGVVEYFESCRIDLVGCVVYVCNLFVSDCFEEWIEDLVLVFDVVCYKVVYFGYLVCKDVVVVD